MKRLKSIFDVSITALVMVAATLVILREFASPAQGERRSIEDVSGTVGAEVATHVRGTGPVALIEFADFECPFCGTHARDVEPMILEAFVDTGIVRHIFVNFPLGTHLRASPASEAALCAGNQGRFWEMRDALFRNQAALSDRDLTDRARDLGLDMTQFSQCVAAGHERKLIERHKGVGHDLAVRSTPSFFLGVVQEDGSVVLKKRINGALSFGDFRSAIVDVSPSEKEENGGVVGLDVSRSVRRERR